MRLSLTRRADYAVRAMLALAGEPDHIRSGSQLARTTGIPAAFVSQVMGDLSAAGLVHARVGRAGGYLLARPVSEISMLSVVEAVEGDVRRRKCVLRNSRCGEDQPCAVHNLFAGAQEALIDRLAVATLASASGNGYTFAPAADRKTEPIFRRVQPGDRADLVDFYSNLSAESRYARFLGFTRGVGEEMARSFCTPDHMHDEGFVALLADPTRAGPLRIIGHLCLQPAGERRLELAVAVTDAYQGRGIGRQLMASALAWAQSRGIEAIIANAFADNVRVLKLLSSAPFPARVLPADGGVVDVIIPLVVDLLPASTAATPVELRASARPRDADGDGRRRVSRSCRVVWRDRPQPEPAAADSTSTGSS